MNAAEMLDDARVRLAAAPRERYAQLVVARRVLGIPRAPRIAPQGSAWHLGALLLTPEALLATGEIIRARQEAPRGYPAESQRRRAALAAAARRGGFAEGEVVHIGWRVLDLDALEDDAGLVALRDGVASVRWSSAGAYLPLERYVAERVELLLHPPIGAT